MHVLASLWLCIPLLMMAFSVKGDQHFVENTFVIEFRHPPQSFATKERMLQRRHSILHRHLQSNNISYRIRHEYEFMNAVSITFDTSSDAEHFFEQAKDIKQIWPVNTVAKPSVVSSPVVQDGIVPTLFELYNTTGIHRVHNELGLTGTGIKVGVIDTGVDYMHPALGGCFGPNCRIAYGYDFVGDDYTGDNQPNPDNDPRDTCNGHGTHVTGIIAANDLDKNFTGIAPNVTIGAYRVFGCAGSSADDVIMKAMEQAYLDGMDVINLSLGDIGWPESPASVLADRLALQGMAVCAAAGNEGEKGVFEVGAPSLGRHAISVASIDNARVLAHAFQVDQLKIGYTTATGTPFNLSSVEIVPLSSTFLASHDACTPISQDINLVDKVVLINRGDCLFTEKILNAQRAGAAGVIIYNNKPGVLTPSVTDASIKIVYGGISLEDGEKLFQLLTNGTDLQAEFFEEDISFSVPTAGTISPFSSWGLGPDLSIKPDVSAPGGQIYSTYPLDLGEYATLSGTSMASPHVAGIVALLQQARGGGRSIPVNVLRTMLINNAHPFKVFNDTIYDSVARQGGGLIDVYQALRSTTALHPEQIRLNDQAHAAPGNKYTFTIKNNGRMSAKYHIKHMSSGTAQGFGNNTIANRIYPLASPILLPADASLQATVQIPHPVVTVEANEQANVSVHINPPAAADAIPPSIYSGYLVIEKNGGSEEVLYLPYAGFTSSLSTLPVLNINETMPSVISTHATSISPAIIRLQLAEPSALLYIIAVDAKNASESYGLVPGGYVTYVGRNVLEDPDDLFMMPWYGNIADTPDQAMHKAQRIVPKLDAASIARKKASPLVGTQLAPGAYRLKIHALRPFGNILNPDDFDTWLSPVIKVKS